MADRETISPVPVQNHTQVAFPPSAMALHWCGPPKKGLEIGPSAWNDFGLDSLKIGVDDAADRNYYDRVHLQSGYQAVPIDIHAEGDDLPLPDSSQDYILSSHVLEHMPNVIKALLEWHRVTRPGGIVYLVIPRRNALEPDVHRPITSIHEFWEDYKQRYTADTHPLEGVPGGRRGHYHVFALEVFLQLIHQMNDRFSCRAPILQVVDLAPSDDKVGNGFVVVLKVLKT